ncbi:hypothetical protein CDAR_19911 [Caerostris darwini]|uniref:Uncharacterized protein n=1 Tax=Caerostris darwini TaxID=1538125 RepID=A0AAV4PZM1_9ARAC|nr:hypothetical protein CDAR_19911 [Caerostris darwini]
MFKISRRISPEDMFHEINNLPLFSPRSARAQVFCLPFSSTCPDSSPISTISHPVLVAIRTQFTRNCKVFESTKLSRLVRVLDERFETKLEPEEKTLLL